MSFEQSDNPHYAVLQRVVSLLQCIEIPCFKSDEIYESEFPFVNAPTHGVHVSLLTERTGAGTTMSDDIAYGVQVTRVLRSLGQKGYIADRAKWRQIFYKYFHNKRICPEGVCETITKVRPATIDVPESFARSGIDPSVMEVWVWTRHFPECGISAGNTIDCNECES